MNKKERVADGSTDYGNGALQIVFIGAILCFAAMSPIEAQVAASPTPPPAALLSPEGSKSFDPAAATRAWLDTVPKEKREKSDAYFEGGYWLILWNYLITVVISILL